MCRPVRYALRFMVMVAVIASLPILLSPSSGEGTPYLSALSDLTVSSVLAAKPGTCSNSICAELGFRCGSMVGYNCVRTNIKCHGSLCT